jgi:DMSO/TMAO reductase YedYZ molybdopterin-dependent catalytic subunit
MSQNDSKNTNEFNENLIRAKTKRAQDKRGILSGGIEANMNMVQGSGSANRHGMPRIPIGQHEVPNWPVLDLGVQPDIPLKDWSIEIKGDVEHPFRLSWKEFLALPQAKDTSDFHCVTTWSRMDNQWKGVAFKTIAEKAKPKPAARFVYMTGYDGYSTNLRLNECLDDDVLLVHTWNGIPLPREHGGPVRMITPKKYAWKGSKWIKEIIFLSEEQLGFWELRGYSNTAEPWFNDRYSS